MSTFVFYFALGCKLNFAETSTLGKILEENGIRKVRSGEKADICVINTCSVTELADKKCRQTIRKIARQHPGAFIVVTGCYAQLKPEEISHIPDVDLILGAEQKLDILQYLGDLQKKQKGNIVTTPTKDIKKFSGSSPVRRKRNCHYRSQHRRLRQTNRRNLSRPHRVPRSSRRNRTLPYILDRTQSTDRRHHFVRGPIETIRPSFPYTSAIG